MAGQEQEATAAALSVPKTARRLDVSPQTVRNLIAAKRLRAIQLGGRGSKIIVPVEAIEEFLRGGEHRG